MTEFLVEKPRYTTWQWIKSSAIRLIFPPVLLWDLLKFIVNKLAGEFVGKLVLPAQDRDFGHFQWVGALASIPEGLAYYDHTVITHDGARLATLEIEPMSQKNFEPKNKKYIINFVGNMMCYEDIIKTIQTDAKALQCNVIGFNFRGVNKSTGCARSTKDLVTDAIAQIQRLLDQGVLPGNITLKGYSIGAAIATLAAHHLHQQGHTVNIFNDRSFSSITNILVGHIRTEFSGSGHMETTLGKCLGWVAKPFIKFAIVLCGWEINAGDAFIALPKENRDYMLVRTNKQARSEEHYDDIVIPHYASIRTALTKERRQEKTEFNRLIKATENELERQLLIAAKNNLKNNKMEIEPGKNGHEIEECLLKNRAHENGVTFFRKFLARTAANHTVSAPIFGQN